MSNVSEIPKAGKLGRVDRRELPLYTITEAALYLRIPVATLRSWAKGRKYPTMHGPRHFAELFKIADEKNGYLSFYNLVESHILAATRKVHGVRMYALRHAIDYVSKEFPSPHPLLSQDFYTNGTDLFIKTLEETINVSRRGQFGLKPILDLHLARIERDDKALPLRLYPLTTDAHQEDRPIVMTPGVSSGRPTIAGTGVLATVVWQRARAGETLDVLADDYDVPKQQLEKAIEYVDQLKAA